ncbi:MAG: hypothetical protein LBH51_00195 [Treponema sp.]|nr:hypothetical protein [Treponema sp.]
MKKIFLDYFSKNCILEAGSENKAMIAGSVAAGRLSGAPGSAAVLYFV